MNNRSSSGFVAVSVLQVISILILPPSMLAELKAGAWGVIAALFILLGVNLLRKRSWARMATIFVQGFNIIVRLLVLLGSATQTTPSGVVTDYWMLGTFVLSMLASAFVLYYVERPEVQMVMQ